MLPLHELESYTILVLDLGTDEQYKEHWSRDLEPMDLLASCVGRN